MNTRCRMKQTSLSGYSFSSRNESDDDWRGGWRGARGCNIHSFHLTPLSSLLFRSVIHSHCAFCLRISWFSIITTDFDAKFANHSISIFLSQNAKLPEHSCIKHCYVKTVFELTMIFFLHPDRRRVRRWWFSKAN